MNKKEKDTKLRKTNPNSQKVIDKLHQKEPTVYTAKEFCDLYCQKETVIEKQQFIKNNVVVVNYMPYQIKCKIADDIVNSCIVDADGNMNIDSRVKYFAYIDSIFRFQTNIHFKEDNMFIEYDLLDSLGLINEIIKLIPETEMDEFRTIVQMTFDDKITNKFSFNAYMDRFMKGILPILKLGETIDTNKIDMKKVIELINSSSN